MGGGLKDARSLSLYPCNRSQILQYVKYTSHMLKISMFIRDAFKMRQDAFNS